MTQSLVSRHSVHVGEVLALALGFAICTLAVFARMYTKVYLTGKTMTEDYVSIVAWLFFLAYIALAVIIGKNEGSVEHNAYLSSIESTIYCPIMALVKISILLQYITVFVTHRGTIFHHAVRGLIWTNVLFYATIIFLYLFECNPRQKLWKPSLPGHCFSRNQIGVASGVINVASDFSILLLPVPLICGLQVSWIKKSRVIAVFSVGLLACIASILRLVYSSELVLVLSTKPTYQLDVDRIGLWAFAEIAIGITVGCLPVLPRLFKHLASKEAGSWSTFKVLSKSSGTSQRRVLRKSRGHTSYDKVSSPIKAPSIEMLNLTHDSHQLAEKDLPRNPLPVYIERPSAAARHNPTFHVLGNGYKGNGSTADVEGGVPAGWPLR